MEREQFENWLRTKPNYANRCIESTQRNKDKAQLYREKKRAIRNQGVT